MHHGSKLLLQVDGFGEAVGGHEHPGLVRVDLFNFGLSLLVADPARNAHDLDFVG